MSLVKRAHEGWMSRRRVRVLSEHLTRLAPRAGKLLEVGSGDGRIAAALAAQRPDLEVQGVDVLVREDVHFPVTAYEGRTLPFEDGSFDNVLLVDVLHHCGDPLAMLLEARRVSRRWLLVKDHTLEGVGARATLRFMDRVGNERFGVALAYEYWPRRRWRAAFEELGLEVREWDDRLGLYPWFLRPLFERSLHFLALLERGRYAPEGLRRTDS